MKVWKNAEKKFKKGDIVNLPEEVANILIVDNKVESVEEE